jgi:RNA polymerase sigma-70 factor, ECF subfamily
MADGSDQWADSSQRADGEAWQQWLDRHGPTMLLLARQWTASHSDAEDIVQEAFIRFWRSRDRVTEPAGYLFACVKHVALDAQRSRRRQLRREEATARPESQPLFAAPIEQDERRTAIESALRTLPANQAEVLVLRIWGELTFSQIAAALEVSENTAASRYRYALARLREQLAEETIS